MVFYIMQKSKTILVTGATSGVGLALAKKLLKLGHTVWATGRKKELLEELQRLGAKTVRADLVHPTEMDNLVQSIDDVLDVVIFSAGVGTFTYAKEVSDREVEQTMIVNVIRPIQLTKRLLPKFHPKKGGQFIFIGSQAGKVATPKTSVYAASKHALIGYTNALRMELTVDNIVVTTIHPGPIDTPFLEHADHTGQYRHAVKKQLLSIDKVVDATIQTIGTTKREVNLPGYMGLTSKLYAVIPTMIERLGKRFFYKK